MLTELLYTPLYTNANPDSKLTKESNEHKVTNVSMYCLFYAPFPSPPFLSALNSGFEDQVTAWPSFQILFITD